MHLNAGVAEADLRGWLGSSFYLFLVWEVMEISGLLIISSALFRYCDGLTLWISGVRVPTSSFLEKINDPTADIRFSRLTLI